MFYFLSKALLILLNPLVWTICLLVIGIRTKSKIKRKKCMWASMVLLFLFSNPVLIHYVQRLWEPETITVDDIEEPYDVGIVLSGYTKILLDRPNRDYFYYLADGYHRLLHSMELYKLEKIEKIMLSGRISSDNQDRKTIDFLVDHGIDRDDIILETASLNTHQSAEECYQMFGEELDSISFLLITSAFHMPRSKQCFDKANLTATPFAVDRTSRSLDLTFNNLLPNPNAIGQWQRLLKEWVGIIVYKLMGYI